MKTTTILALMAVAAGFMLTLADWHLDREAEKQRLAFHCALLENNSILCKQQTEE